MFTIKAHAGIGLGRRVYYMYQMNKILGWYLVCRKYGVVKDIRRYVIRKGFLNEANRPQYSDLYTPYLSPLQKFEIFNSSNRISPSMRRELLKVPYLTFEERYGSIKRLFIVFGPILLIIILTVVRG